MLNTTAPINNVSILGNNVAASNFVADQEFFQRLSSLSSTIVSFQYNTKEFLSFHVRQAKHGKVVSSGTEGISLRCQIGERIYTFNHEHFNQMSNRECNELFSQLGVDGSHVFS
ncbi:MAG TPA: hypothetical protein V6D14_12430 [Coleofasciculaceae cyanobacterium]|jgi:hypothetical protein